MLRLGHSLGNAELNKKYSIESLAGFPAGKPKDFTPEKQEALDAAKLQLVEQCQVLFLSA